MRRTKRQYHQGFTLIEIIIVLVILAIVTTAVVVNIRSASTIRVEAVLTEVRASIANSRREALKSNPNPKSTTITLSSIYGNNLPAGIKISSTSTSPVNTHNCSCGDNLSSLCLPDQPFCYDTGDNSDITLNFELGSGRLASNRAIFISSETRNLALLINKEGTAEIAELIDGQWRSQTSLQATK